MPKHHKVSHHANHYRVGLGETMLVRSRVIFLGLIAILVLSSGTAIYAGVKNGSLQKNIIEPSKQMFAAIGESFKESSESAKPNYGQIININNGVSDTTDLIIESPKPQSSSKPTQQAPTQQQTIIYYTTPSYAPRPQPSMKSYEERVQEMDAKAAADWEAALKRQAELSAQSRAKNDAWFEQQKAESQARLEAWKKEHGF